MYRSFLLVIAAAVLLPAADADLILHNGKILTVDAKFSVQEAVALRGGKITAVGRSQSVLGAERGSKTEVIDLGGCTVLPGLIDSHVHAVEAGLSEFRGPLPPLDSFAAVQAYIRERARKTPQGQWIVVPRTFPTRLKEMRMPTREALDVTTDHPVMFDASCVVVANSLALKISGITRDTPDPPGGVIVKDEKGQPNGILRKAQSLLKGVSPAQGFTEREKLEALERMLKRYLAAGLTSIGEGAAGAEEISLDRERPIAPTRSHLIHASFQSREAIARAKKPGILADVPPAWLYHDAPALEQVFTYDGLRHFIPLRAYLDAGVIVSDSSDHRIGYDKNKAVNPYNPFFTMWVAVSRRTARGRVRYHEERVSREEALRMQTIWPAYLQFAEEVKGSIEPGKLADLVVIDRDYLTCPEDQIKDIAPVMTILDGKIVYRR